jgi:hypothetical protein
MGKRGGNFLVQIISTCLSYERRKGGGSAPCGFTLTVKTCMKTIQKVHFKLQTICLYKMFQGRAGGNGVKVVCVDPWIVLLLSIVF